MDSQEIESSIVDASAASRKRRRDEEEEALDWGKVLLGFDFVLLV